MPYVLTSIGVRLLDAGVEIRGVQNDLLEICSVSRDDCDPCLSHEKYLVMVFVLHVQTRAAKDGNRRVVLRILPAAGNAVFAIWTCDKRVTI